MKLKKYIHITLVLLTAWGVAYANPLEQQQVPDAIMTQMAAQYQDEIENLLKPITKAFEDIDATWEDLALTVSNNATQTKNKAQVVQEIRRLRASIATLTKSAYVNLDIIGLIQLIKTAEMLATHLEDCINNGLTEIVDFREQESNKITQDDIAKIIQSIEQLNKKVENIKKRASKAGLTWYNTLARTVDDWLVQPAQKVSLPKYAFIGGITGILGLYYWYHSSSENSLLRKFLGWAPKYDNTGHLNESFHLGGEEQFTLPNGTTEILKETAHPLKWAGQLENWIFQQRKDRMPLAEWLLPMALLSYKKELVSGKNLIGKHMNRIANFLKGGEYRNKKDGTDSLSKVTFDDIVGREHAKEVFSKVLKYLEDPERFARLNLVPEKGYLLYGPSRTGKSHFAKALAGEIQKLMVQMGRSADSFGFYEIKVDWITKIDDFQGIMDSIKQKAPCVVFIDEIDLLGLQRAGDKNMLGQFLTTLSGIMDSDPKKQVIILAATNKAENLDFALRQHGRFGQSIFFDLPTLVDRTEYIIKRLDSLAIDTSKFDIKKFALETQGYHFDNINAAIKDAFQKSKIVGTIFSQELLEQSFDEVVRKILTADDKQLNEKEQSVIATHQAADALTRALLNTEEKVAKVTICPVAEKLNEELVWEQYNPDKKAKQNPIVYGKVFTYRENDTANIINATDKMTQCKLLLAGSVAEHMILGTTGGSYNGTNRTQALTIMQSIAFNGIDPKELPKKRVEELRDKAFQMFQECEKEVETLLNNNKEALTKLIEALKKQKTLTGSEVEALIKQ